MNRSFLLLVLVLLLGQAFLWSRGPSGTLEASRTFASPHPDGYARYIDDQTTENHPVHASGMRALYLHQALLYRDGGEGLRFLYFSGLTPSSRNMTIGYAFWTRALWFLGPYHAAVALNILLWLLALWGGLAMMRALEQPALSFMALLVASGQGFLHTVGDATPRTAGFAMGFILIGLACHLKLWQQESKLSHHLLLYLVLGTLQTLYPHVWIHLPVLLTMSTLWLFHKRRQKPAIPYAVMIIALLMLLTVALLPTLLQQKLLTAGGLLPDATTSPGQVLLERLGQVASNEEAQAQQAEHYLTQRYLKLGVANSALAMGHFLLLALGVGLLRGIKNPMILGAGGLLLLQLLIYTPHIMHGGYHAVFDLAPLWLAVAAYGLAGLWQMRLPGRVLAIALVSSILLWNNLLPLTGSRFSSQGFQSGYMSQSIPYQFKEGYHVQLLP